MNGAWVELDQMCMSQQVHATDGNNMELRDLKPEATYRIELRAHNAIGLSEPSTILLKTARGESTGSSGTFIYRAGYMAAASGAAATATDLTVPKIHSLLLCLCCSFLLLFFLKSTKTTQ